MMKTPTPATQKQIEQIFRGVALVIPNKEEIIKALKEPTKALRVKFGIDPTTPDYHFGYFVVFRKLRLLQELGHKIILLIGGYTARFGDPTDKIEGRALRDKEDLKEAVEVFKKQAALVLDLKKTEIRDNSEWYEDMSAEELLRLMSEVTVAQMLERDMFKKRVKENKAIGLHEPVYPLLQGYDSVQLKSDLTVIGTDQLFNENVARPLQERRGQKPQGILGLELISGTDGTTKMSQSLGNAILLSDSAEEQFGKLMSIPDSAAGQYAKMLTTLELKDVNSALAIGGEGARDAKIIIAENIVGQLHGEEKAEDAANAFRKKFAEKEKPKKEDLETYIISNTTNSSVALRDGGLYESASRATQDIQRGGIRVGGVVHKDPRKPLNIPKEGTVLEIGKKRTHWIEPQKK